MTRVRRASYSYASGLVFTLVTTATGLLITPWILAWLGAPAFGVVRALVECAGYLTLLDLGLGAALSPLLARALAQDDGPALRSAMAAGLRFYRVVTLITIALGLAATPWITRVVQGAGISDSDVRTAWICTVLAFAPLALAPFRALIDSEQRAYIANLALCVQAILIAVASLAFAYVRLGATGQALAVAIVSPMTAAFLAIASTRRHPGLLRGLRRPTDPGAKAALAHLGGPSLAVNLANRLGLISDNIILTVMLGPAEVTALFVTQRLATIAAGQIQAVGTSSWAALAEIHARGQRDLFNRRLVELTRVVAVLGVAMLAPIVAFNSQFLVLWLRVPIDGGLAVAAVAAINAILVATCTLWTWAFTGTGQVRRLVASSAVSAAINVAASVLLTRRLGLVGPILGTTTAYLSVQAWYLPALLARHFGTSRRALAWALAAPVLAGVPFAAALRWLAMARPSSGVLLWAAEMAASGAAFLLFGAFALIDATDRAIWRARISNLIHRRPGG
jgi:O-antigen/teichoic acid export membrane protein